MSMSLESAPVEMLFAQMVWPQNQKMVGKSFQIAHLQSARGQTLNGKTCTVRGFERDCKDCRLHCFIQETNETIKLKATNLIPLDSFPSHASLEKFMEHSPPISNAKLLSCLESAVQKHQGSTGDREDLLHRLRLYKRLIKKLRQAKGKKNKQPLAEGDYCLPCGAGADELHGNFGFVMQRMKPTCWGNCMMDMRHIDIGLKGDDHTSCSVCHEVIASQEKDNDASKKMVLVTLPCLHVFHEACVTSWLESDVGKRNWNCPTCRHVVPLDMSTYCVEYDEQLQRRFDEYLLSGFCTKCIIMVIENKRNDEIGYENEEGQLELGPVAIDTSRSGMHSGGCARGLSG